MTLRMGAAETDITPRLGTHLAGDACRHRPAARILDPLFARALVFESTATPGTRGCLLTLDLCTIGDECGAEIRRRAAKRLGIEPSAVIVHLMQNHSAPGLGTHRLLRPNSPCVRPDYWWVYTGDPDYYPELLPRLDAAVEQAMARLEPVRIGCFGKPDSRISFVRRFHMRSGWIGYIPTREGHQARNFNFRSPEGRPVRRGANLFLLAPDALETITTEARRLLNDMRDV